MIIGLLIIGIIIEITIFNILFNYWVYKKYFRGQKK